VSKKNRTRRSAPPGKAPSAGGRARPGRTSAADGVERVLASLWAAIAAGDLLRSELETAYCMAIPLVAGIDDPDEVEAFISAALIGEAVRRRAPEGAALLRLLMALGTPDTRREASRALAELTGADVYPPDWVTEIGKATPGRAWRRYDILGDDEAILVTFSYGEAEHALLAQVDLTGIPVATAIAMSSSPASVIEAISRDDEEFDGHETISLAEARRRLIGALDRSDYKPEPDMSVDPVVYLPIARSRVRRIPAGEPGPVFTAADRAAAVDEFMKSPLAAEAVAADEESTRFWAEVLTGYSGRVPGEPPAQVGPRKLAHILLGHVPNTFGLSPAQRQHLEPAVSAWLRWSAEHRNLGEAATVRLMEQLPRVLSRFGQAYDDPDAVVIRGYASDLAASDADVAWLSRNVGRRMFALPLPEGRARLNLADPAERRALVEEEFGACTPPAGLTSEQFTAAAQRVVEELWHEENATFAAAERMFTDGVPRHDIIHRLAAAPAEGIGSPVSR
jgi:hypothetical protein